MSINVEMNVEWRRVVEEEAKGVCECVCLFAWRKLESGQKECSEKRRGRGKESKGSVEERKYGVLYSGLRGKGTCLGVRRILVLGVRGDSHCLTDWLGLNSFSYILLFHFTWSIVQRRIQCQTQFGTTVTVGTAGDKEATKLSKNEKWLQVHKHLKTTITTTITKRLSITPQIETE